MKLTKLIIFLFCLLFPVTAWAEPAPTQDRWFYGQIYVDNIRVTSAYATSDDGYCYLDKNDRLMISLRGLISMLDMDIQWDADTQQVIIPESKNGRVVFQLNSKEYFVNGEKKIMDTEAVSIAPGRVHVPLRYLAESIGAEVQYGDFVAFDMKQIDIITSEEKAAENLKNSNVRQWAKNVCALNKLPLGEGYYESGLTKEISDSDKELARTFFADLGIKDKEVLLSILNPEYFPNSDFMKIALLQQIGVTDLGYTEEEAVYMLPYTQELLAKWQDKCIKCSDKFIMIGLFDFGYTAGYLTEREAIQLISLYAEPMQKEFDNWNMVVDNYFDGRVWYQKLTPQEREQAAERWNKKYAELKNSPDYYFDDTMFSEKLEG